MTITYGSVCSGIEAATVAWHPLGMRAAWYAEIEAFPSAVLAYRYPETANLGDMTRLAALVLAGKIEAPDVLVGGTPCQAFSVAGMREGLADPRGALTIKYVELADAIDHVRVQRGQPESVAVWENVPGVLSDKGNAFGCFLGALVGESEELQPPGKRWADAGCVYGPRRAVAWRILDAQYFGLAQRRRRVFVVASARSDFDPASVLFEREGLRRDHPPRRGEASDVAGTLTGGARKHGGYSTDDLPCVAAPLTTNPYGDHEPRESLLVFGGNNTRGPIDVAPARNACASASGRMDFESEAFVVHGTQDPDVSRGLAHALGRNQGQENAVLAFSCKDHGADAGHIAPTLRAMAHGDSHANAGGQVAVCVTGDIAHTLKAEGFDASEDGTGRGQPIINHTGGIHACASEADACSALRALRESVGAEAFAEWGSGVLDSLQSPKVLQSWLHGGIIRRQAGEEKSILDDSSLSRTKGLPAGALRDLWEAGPDGRSSQGRELARQLAKQLGQALPQLPPEGTPEEPRSSVRRLTPVECERLMGFPDDHTLIPWRGRPAAECPDGPRYKAIGNSKAVPVVRWIGRRLVAALP